MNAPVHALPLPGTDPNMAPGPDEMRRRRARVCRWILRICRAAPQTSPGRLSAEAMRALAPNPYHEILIDLYLAELTGRRVYQSGLAGTGPAVSTHRQAARLEELGAVTRTVDPADQRRLNVALTPAMRAHIEDILDKVDAAIRKGDRDFH